MQKGLDDARNGRVTPLDDIYAKLSEAISEIKNGSQGADAEKFIKNLNFWQKIAKIILYFWQKVVYFYCIFDNMLETG